MDKLMVRIAGGIINEKLEYRVHYASRQDVKVIVQLSAFLTKPKLFVGANGLL